MRSIDRINDKRTTLSLALTAIAMVSVAGHGAEAQQTGGSDIVIVNNDGPGEGFNDPTPVAPVAGNRATTLGEQRLAVFEAAADIWEAILVSGVQIEVQAQFDDLPCTANSATLGAAGPITVAADFQGAQVADTFYVAAQANQQAGIDLDPDNADINATFNSRLGDPDCLAGRPFFLGIDGQPAPTNTIGLFDVVLHEIAHGLGFLSIVDITTGERFFDTDDIFSRNLEDQTLGLTWPNLTDTQRAASAINTGNLQWSGAAAEACAAQILQQGAAADGDVLMFAPDPVDPGSSVSHFDTSVSPDELMEPAATPTSILDVTTAAFVDMGWPVTAEAQQQLCQTSEQVVEIPQ